MFMCSYQTLSPIGWHVHLGRTINFLSYTILTVRDSIQGPVPDQVMLIHDFLRSLGAFDKRIHVSVWEYPVQQGKAKRTREEAI